MRALLRDLVELAGQGDASHTAPVLELSFGDILTRTTLAQDGGQACLSILALLPRSEKIESGFGPLWQPMSASDVESELLWHADDGRYVLMRNIPIERFSDEPSVMDAIMDASDDARIWFDGACKEARRFA